MKSETFMKFKIRSEEIENWHWKRNQIENGKLKLKKKQIEKTKLKLRIGFLEKIEIENTKKKWKMKICKIEMKKKKQNWTHLEKVSN